MLTIDDRGKRRILFPNGVTVIGEWDKAREILSEKPLDTKCFSSYDTEMYEKRYLREVSFDIDNVGDPTYESHEHNDKDIDRLLDLIHKSNRWDGENVERIYMEIKYFEESYNILFLLKSYELIQSLKQTTVVGVGRGSACASYVMFLLGMHDINPIQYKIEFSELSKIEEEND